MHFALMLLACENTANTHAADTASPESSPPYHYAVPNLELCDDLLISDLGSLCALKPSRLDPSARDHYSDSTLADRTLGFGYHVVAFPPVDREITGVYVHFTGSMGRAYNQNSGVFPSSLLLNEAMQAGLITIQIAYHNRFSVNSQSECVGATNVDNCAGVVRWESHWRRHYCGGDSTKIRQHSASIANSGCVFRTRVLSFHSHHSERYH